MNHERDHYFMRQALTLAEKAGQLGEVPVGAVMVLNDEIIAEGFNQPIANHDPSAHAEMIAIRRAAEKLGNYRLIDTTLYVTLEPCLMCAGAMVHARINRLVYGTDEPKTGAIQSRCHALAFPFLNHQVKYENGILAAACGDILSAFFAARR